MSFGGCCAFRFSAEIVFFLFRISEAILTPTVRLYIYESACMVRILFTLYESYQGLLLSNALPSKKLQNYIISNTCPQQK